MVDNIDPSTTPPLAPGATDPGTDTAPAIDPNRPPEPQAEPEEESDEAWMRRFIEENIHLASPPVVRPPAPPPQPWDGPRSQWKVPDHLSMPHPKGGYMAMALMSRTMDDLDEVTGGKRAATYEEVDKYFGHALIAEGLVPFTYTADEAIRWWKAGGFRVLGSSAEEAADPLPATRSAEATLMTNASAPDEPPAAPGDATTDSPGRMMINDVADPSQTGTGGSSPSGQQNPGRVPASQPSAASGNISSAGEPKGGSQTAAQSAASAKGPAPQTRTSTSLGTTVRTKGGVANRISGAYLPQNDFILALKNGLLSSVEPDLTRTSEDFTTPAKNDAGGGGAQKRAAIANVDVSADPDAIAFVNAIGRSLTAAKVKGKNQTVEKHIMVEWDSSLGGYVVTGIKILPPGGGHVGAIAPRLAESRSAIRNNLKPRAFVIHTHAVNAEWGELPGEGDASPIKGWLIPNFVVADNGAIHEVIMAAGVLNPKNGKYNNPRIRVARISKNGTSNIIPDYSQMPK